MRRGALVFLAAVLATPVAAARAAPAQPTPTPPALAQPARPGVAAATPQDIAQLEMFQYLMALSAMQAARSAPGVSQEQVQSAVHDYFTNGAKATAVPTSGPAAAYFQDATKVLAQVNIDIGKAGTATAPDAGAPAASATPTTTATATAAPTTTGAPGAAEAQPSSAIGFPTAPATASPTATATTTATAMPTATANPAAGASPAPGETAGAAAGAASPAAAPTVTVVQPIAVPTPAPAPAPAPTPERAVTTRSGATWAVVFAAGAALGALLVAIGGWLRAPRRRLT